MNNLNEKCLLLFDELLTRKGIKRTKLTKAQLAEAPYALTCDSYYIGGKKQTDEIVIKGSTLVDKQNSQEIVCLLVKDLTIDAFCIKILNVKAGSKMCLDHMIKITYDKTGFVRHDFLQRKEAVYKGSLSAFCKPPALQNVVNYVTNSNFTVGLA